MPGNLPLVEFALTALWEQQTQGELMRTAYEAVGRVEGALSRHADEVFEGLSEAEQTQAHQVFVQLVRPGEGTEDTRRIATQNELSEADWLLVQQLASARLVVTDRDPAGQETVEVAHEALIRGWGRLKAWMDQNRDFRAWQERLRIALYQWQSSQQDEGILLRGKSLADADRWLAEREDDLSPVERNFIQASQNLRERERKREKVNKRFRQLAIALLLLVALLLGRSWWSSNCPRISGYCPTISLLGIVLFRVDLYRADLSYADLHEADLAGANLFQAILFRADLSYADLRGANLAGASLFQANLDKAKFNEKTLWPDGVDPEKAGAELVEE